MMHSSPGPRSRAAWVAASLAVFSDVGTLQSECDARMISKMAKLFDSCWSSKIKRGEGDVGWGNRFHFCEIADCYEEFVPKMMFF
jgi:hypothetical protein